MALAEETALPSEVEAAMLAGRERYAAAKAAEEAALATVDAKLAAIVRSGRGSRPART